MYRCSFFFGILDTSEEVGDDALQPADFGAWSDDCLAQRRIVWSLCHSGRLCFWCALAKRLLNYSDRRHVLNRNINRGYQIMGQIPSVLGWCTPRPDIERMWEEQRRRSPNYSLREGRHRVLGLEKRHFRLFLLLWQIRVLPPEMCGLAVVMLYRFEMQSIIDEALEIGWQARGLGTRDNTVYLLAPQHFACRGWAHCGAQIVIHYRLGWVALTDTEIDPSLRRTGRRGEEDDDV
jgi:hypothetical protein